MKNASLSENLLYQRKLKGYTQEDLSEKTTVGVRTIQRIEKGETQPHLQTVKLLAVGLDIEVNDLLPIDNPNEETIQRKWMLLLHGIPFLGFIIPFGNILFPLFLWIHKANDNKIYDYHGRAIINFHSSITLYFIISLLLFFPLLSSLTRPLECSNSDGINLESFTPDSKVAIPPGDNPPSG